MELVLASRFGALFGPTKGPDVALFKRFQIGWPYIDQSACETASDDMFDSCTAVLRPEEVSPGRVSTKRRLQGTPQSLHDFSSKLCYTKDCCPL